MSDRKRWSVIIALTVLAAGAFGGMIYMEHGSIVQLRTDVSGKLKEIDDGRRLIAQTPALEKNVIIQRETDSVVAQILPSDEDLNNFVRTLRSFQEKSGARIVDVKNKNLAAKQNQSDFDRVVYTLKFDANVFQMLGFIAQVENHARFMSVPALKLTAARRSGNDRDVEEEPRHQVQMDVETYVYEPKDQAKEVQIDNYERKRDLLLSEISRRQADLHVASYEYRGQRGRRDPWVDPRVPLPKEGEAPLPIEQQILLVDDLVERTREAESLWEAYRDADNLIAQMKTRADLDEAMAALAEDVRVVQDKKQLVFVSAERRFQKEVIEALDELHAKLNNAEDVVGPTVAILQEAIETVDGYLRTHEYDQALKAFYAVEPRLQLAEDDAARKPLVSQLRWLARVAETVIEFDGIEMRISGVGLIEGLKPIAVINGESLTEGEMVAANLFIRSIREDEIEFVYRDVIMSRRIEP
jgi:hypothetical protein